MVSLKKNNPALKGLLAFVFGMPVGFLISAYVSYNNEILNEFFSRNAAISSLLTGVSGIANFYLGRFLNIQFPWRKSVGTRLILGIGSTFLLLGVIFILPVNLFITDSREILAKMVLLALVAAVVFNVIFFAVYSFYQFSSTQVAYVENQKRQSELQLQALRSQLSPHFLFNCLNTISSLLYKDVEKAELFIRQLAKTYQSSLERKNVQTISVAEELEFVRAYQYLLQVRFDDLVSLNVDLDEKDLATEIPPMTLQLLMENAVKHNMIKNEMRLAIHVRCEKKWLIVKNNKTLPPPTVRSFKIGLENIRSRYMLLKNKDIRVIDDQNYFEVRLPLLSA